jgi:hypothetical protein
MTEEDESYYEHGGVIYSPARVDPFSAVQVADFSNIQYYGAGDSEVEQNGKSALNLVRVNQANATRSRRWRGRRGGCRWSPG